MKNLSSIFSNLDYRQRVMYPLWVFGVLGLFIFFALYLAFDSVFSEAVKANTASKEQLTGISDAVFNTLLYMFFAFIGGFVAIAAFGKQLANGPAGLLRKTEDVLKKVSTGVFSDRIVDITQKDELGRIAWLVNDSVDQIEALLKELTTSIEYSSQGKFFRKPRLEGTKGMMRFTSEKVAQAIERQEKLTSSLRGERQQYEEMNTKIIDALSEITAGNLTVQIHGAKDENSRAIYEKFNRLVHQFAEIVNSLNHQGEQWNRIAEVIASNSEAISSRALQQKTQSEEIEMAVGDMAKTIFDISKNTSAAHSTAQQSGRLAEDGGKVIKQALSTMDIIGEIVTDTVNIVDSLGKSSNEIGIITQVIGDIAEQTNLLALNAAIEAARAGEQGRGFAVVADEVRKLAERTAASTKQIDKVVADITRGSEAAIEAFKKNSQKVAEGKNVAAHAESSLSEIISGSLKVSDMINQVSAASEELAATAEQVNKNIENITAFIRQNTDDMNNIAESTESLNAVVAESKSLSNKFNTSNNNDSLMLSGNTTAANIDAAIKAHKLWKVKITKMVNGQEHVANNSVVSHKECQLGKLYYNEWAQIFAGNSLYHELGAVHQEMHDLLKRTVQAYNKGNRHEARSNAEKVYQLSDEVVAKLQKLKMSY